MSEHDKDFAFEPVPGLPALPPQGEVLLWQGRPATFRLAMEAYGLPWVAGYFVLIVGWRAALGFDVGGLAGAFAYGIPYAVLGLIGCGIVLALAAAQARATVYTITTARVALRIGAALSVTINLPFAQIASAGLHLSRGGHGTIALQTLGDTRISWLVCWPHVRPWRLSRTQPALRAIPDAARVAQVLAEAAETRISQPVVSRATGFAAIAAE